MGAHPKCIPLILPYAEWVDQETARLTALNPSRTCTNCHGDGEVSCECENPCDEASNGDWCGAVCSICEGDKRLCWATTPDNRDLSVTTYLSQVRVDITHWCQMTGDDYLSVMGRWVSEFRSTSGIVL